MRRFRLWLLLPGAAGALLCAALLLYFVLLRDLPDPGRIDGAQLKPSILITDRQGRLLYEAIDPQGSKHTPLPLEEVPLACRQATIATEDSRFFRHPGVDLVAVLRAAWQNWRAGGTVSGGSTLTQQLARNLFLSQEERTEQSVRRKLREAWLAWRMEQRYTKDELLALYLNTTYYGHFAVGIEAAAQSYFGVHAQELDLAQCALLAGLPQYPSGYNPIENPEAARQRQQVVLRLMVAQGAITAAQAADAGRERLSYASTPFPVEAPHFVMWVQSQLEGLLPPEALRGSAVRVVTTLDLDWQAVAEEVVQRRLTQLRPCASTPGAEPGITCDATADPARRVENAALVALDPRTGAVRAMVGSPDYFDVRISGALNAALSLRQPGSAIKPLTYALALDPERGRLAGVAPWTAATLIPDIRTVFPTAEGDPYVPNNYDRRYHGPVTLRTALANSYNIPAVAALHFVGVESLVKYASELGIQWDRLSVAPWPPADSEDEHQAEDARMDGPEGGQAASRYGLGLALGAGEVRLLDLVSAYAAFASGGRRVTPYAIERVETLSGEELASGTAMITPAAVTLIDPKVAYLITDILSDQAARLPAFGANNMLEIGRPAAVKTGTTTDWRDNWSVGFTPDLVTGVWVGNADNTAMKDVSGITGAAPIWHDFMVAVLRDTPVHEFVRPDGLVQVEVCADSGLLPGNGDPPGWPIARVGSHGGAAPHPAVEATPVACPLRRLEWFITGTEPDEIDRSHIAVPIDVRTGAAAQAYTPVGFIEHQVIWDLPAEYRAWARENGIGQLETIGLRQAVSGLVERPDAPRAALSLTSPDPRRVYRIDPGLPAAAQEVPVTASLLLDATPTGQVTLLVDGRPLAVVGGPEYTAWWRLEPGRHTFQASALDAGGRLLSSEIVTVFVE